MLRCSDISSAGKIKGQWLTRHNLKLMFLGWVDPFENDFYINFFLKSHHFYIKSMPQKFYIDEVLEIYWNKGKENKCMS